jgi:hypothetical protein
MGFSKLSLPLLALPLPLALVLSLRRGLRSALDRSSERTPQKRNRGRARNKELMQGAPRSHFQSRFLPPSLSPLLSPSLQTNQHETVRLLREELQLLQEPGSYVGEVIKVRGNGLSGERERERWKEKSSVIHSIFFSQLLRPEPQPRPRPCVSLLFRLLRQKTNKIRSWARTRSS